MVQLEAVNKRQKQAQRKIEKLELKALQVDDGEYGIAVRWLGRLTEDLELRTFDLDAECTDEFIVNSSELRCTHIELMHHCPVGPAVRRSPRGYGGHVRDGRGVAHLQGKCTLPIETEQTILRSCW